MSVRILHGDCRDVLRTLPDASVHCIVTSPPYYGLRDYGVTGQIGLEESPVGYIDALVGVFREARRVLRDDGTLWLNLGDSYATGAGRVGEHPGGGEQGARWAGRGAHTEANSGKHGPSLAAMGPRTQPNRMPLAGFKPKDLMLMPARVALALQVDGWWLRSDIIWAKPNPMPESVTDRPTSAHEHVFLLAKSETYYFDGDAVRDPTVGQEPGELDGGPQRNRDGSNANEGRNFRPTRSGNKERRIASGLDRCRTNSHLGSGVPWEDSGRGRNIRNVWTVTTTPLRDAHFATFPTKLIEPCILAGCPRGGTVLDPFGGAGTTGLVADRLERNALLVELNAEYVEMARRRIAGDAPLLADVATD